MITIYDRFPNSNYQIEEVFFVQQEVLHFLAQNSGIFLELKKKTSLDSFKKLTKKWQPENCPYRLYKSYIQNLFYLGFRIRIFLTTFVRMYMAFVMAIYFSILFG